MAAVTVRNLDDEVAAQLKVRAARHGRSMEAEVRAILTEAVSSGRQGRPNLAQAVREQFAGLSGGDLQIPPRRDLPRAAQLP